VSSGTVPLTTTLEVTMYEKISTALVAIGFIFLTIGASAYGTLLIVAASGSVMAASTTFTISAVGAAALLVCGTLLATVWRRDLAQDFDH
jgi:hypothetical protein